MSVYDPIAELYDEWSRQVTEDIAFYVEAAVAAGGPVVDSQTQGGIARRSAWSPSRWTFSPSRERGFTGSTTSFTA